MKLIHLGLLCRIFTSCSFSKDKGKVGVGRSNSEAATKNIKEQAPENEIVQAETQETPDKDGDNITDSLDPEPNIANLPDISFSNVQTTLTYLVNGGPTQVILNSEESVKTRDFLNSYLLREAYKASKSQDPDFEALNSKKLIGISKTTAQELFTRHLEISRLEEGGSSFSGNGGLNTNFTLEVSFGEHVGQITNILLGFNLTANFNKTLSNLNTRVLSSSDNSPVSFSFEEAQAVTSNDISINLTDLSSENIKNAVKNGEGVVLSIEDFDLVYKEGALVQNATFSDLYESVRLKNARIIFSTEEETKEYFVTPDTNISAFLSQKHGELINSGNIIQSIGSLDSAISLPINYDGLDRESLENEYVWIYATDSDDTLGELTQGKTYLLKYTKLKDLLESNFTLEKKLESQEINRIDSNSQRETPSFNANNGEMIIPMFEGVRHIFREGQNQVTKYVQRTCEPNYWTNITQCPYIEGSFLTNLDSNNQGGFNASSSNVAGAVRVLSGGTEYSLDGNRPTEFTEHSMGTNSIVFPFQVSTENLNSSNGFKVTVRDQASDPVHVGFVGLYPANGSFPECCNNQSNFPTTVHTISSGDFFQYKVTVWVWGLNQ